MLDYLTHPGAIPAQKMALEAAFSEVVKTPGGIRPQATVLYADCDAHRRRRKGAGSMRILP